MRKWLIVCLIAFLLISPVAAEQVTITVEEKRIEGGVFVVGENHGKIAYSKLWEEYPVSADDYAKINYGDKITLEHNSGANLFKLASSESQGWW